MVRLEPPDDFDVLDLEDGVAVDFAGDDVQVLRALHVRVALGHTAGQGVQIHFDEAGHDLRLGRIHRERAGHAGARGGAHDGLERRIGLERRS